MRRQRLRGDSPARSTNPNLKRLISVIGAVNVDHDAGLMAQYRCYFADRDGRQLGWRVFERFSNSEATSYAIGLLAAYHGSHNVEVWDGPSLILRYDLPAPPTPDDLRLLCAYTFAAAEIECDLNIKHALALRAAELAQQAEALERTDT